jgi:hypothetical protein
MLRYPLSIFERPLHQSLNKTSFRLPIGYNDLNRRSPQTQVNVDLGVASGLVRLPYSNAIRTNMNFPTISHLCNLIGPGVQQLSRFNYWWCVSDML